MSDIDNLLLLNFSLHHRQHSVSLSVAFALMDIALNISPNYQLLLKKPCFTLKMNKFVIS